MKGAGMIERYARYAIYWAPEAHGPLAQFGAQWLGWDGEAAAARAHLAAANLPAPLDDITRTPRRYGFHATLKPPFALNGGASPSALLHAVEALAARTPAFDAPPLTLARDHGFASLRLSARSPAMDALAADAVTALDRFRAPLSAADLARRRAAPLGPKAEANLSRWGYPWVMDLFHFHLTLSGPLAPDALARTCDALAPLVAPFCAAPLPVREICIFGDPGGGLPFRLVARAPLDRAPRRP
jgi:putative phosphonate metabolism protein